MLKQQQNNNNKVVRASHALLYVTPVTEERL